MGSVRVAHLPRIHRRRVTYSRSKWARRLETVSLGSTRSLQRLSNSLDEVEVLEQEALVAGALGSVRVGDGRAVRGRVGGLGGLGLAVRVVGLGLGGHCRNVLFTGCKKGVRGGRG